MKVWAKNRLVVPGFIGGALAIALGAGLWLSSAGGGIAWAQSPQPAPIAQEKLNIGVVDFDSLIKGHSSYSRLQQLDEQISILEEELKFLPLGDQRKAVDSSQKRMREAVEKARKEVEAEYRKVNAEMSGLSASMASQFEREGKALQEHYRQELERKVASMAPRSADIPASINAKMEKFLADLAAIRQQRVLARRLELERGLQVRVDAERSRVDAEIAEYDTSIMSENQEQRVNLQLQLQTVSDPEKEAEIQNKLNALGEAESAKKEARSKQLMDQFEAFVAQEKAALEKQLQSYEAGLNREARAQAEAERDRLLGAGPSTSSMASNKEQVNAHVERIKATLNAEMEAKQAQMKSVMEQRSAEAKKRMEKKQAEIQKRLESLQRQLEDMVEKSASEVSDDTKKKMDDTKAKIADLQAQRKDVYDAMVADLSKVVGEVAKKQNVPQVVGSYVSNIDCVDLTDLSMVALKLAQH